MAKIKAWHFLPSSYCLRFRNRRYVQAGDLITVPGKPKLCHYGLHGSRKLVDAIHYAPGPILCRVTIGGEIDEGMDKLCGTERYVEWTLDASWILHEFACWCATEAFNQVKDVDPLFYKLIDVKRAWMLGEITDQKFAVEMDKGYRLHKDICNRYSLDSSMVRALRIFMSIADKNPHMAAGSASSRSLNAIRFGSRKVFTSRRKQEAKLLSMINDTPWEK